MSDDFWDDMTGAFSVSSAIDTHLQGRSLEGDGGEAVRQLTDKYRDANALPTPAEAGTRVRFVANLGSVLSYEDIPDDGVDGTVVTVKTADEGTVTGSSDGRVFVLWDDAKFRPILAEHLRPANSNQKRANAVRMVVSGLEDVMQFFTVHTASGGEELIHRATKDLWSFSEGNDGQFVIERLFSDTGDPLKV